jgi:lysophospholipase L1-like esterase
MGLRDYVICETLKGIAGPAVYCQARGFVIILCIRFIILIIRSGSYRLGGWRGGPWEDKMTGFRLRAILAALACLYMLALIPAMAAAESVACVGDSITENHIPHRLQGELESATGAGWPVYDYGRGGFTTHMLRDEMAAGCFWCRRPTYTFIMAGTNDMVHGYSVDGSVRAMQYMVDMMRRGSDRIVVSLIIPSLASSETEWAKSYNQRLQDNLRGVDYFLKTNWEDFYNPDTNTSNGDLMTDRLHPNDAGYDIIAKNYSEVVLSRQADPCTEKVNNYR